MRDLILSLLIGTTVIFGATETAGLTHFLEGEDPSSAVRRAVQDISVPGLPSLPEISVPDPRLLLPTSAVIAPSPTPSAAAPGSPADVKSMFIARTNGAGVRARPTCADAALGSTGVAEGAAVEFVRAGGDECPGWGLVRSGGLEFWVRMIYLDSAPPRPAAPPAKGASAPAPAPPVDPSSAPPHAEQARPEDKPGRSEDHGEKPPASMTPAPVPTVAATPTAVPSATATPTPTPSATPSPTPTPLPDLPLEDEQ